MYYPYFRGKQFELLALRENASLVKEGDIHPIIEPVKQNLSPLKRAIRELIKNEAKFTIIINPKYGDLKDNNGSILDLISDDEFNTYQGMYLGYILRPGSNVNRLKHVLENYDDYKFSIIHYGFSDSRNLLPVINETSNVDEHVFIEKHSSEAYRNQFIGNGKIAILIRDGFIIMRNADYPEDEHFSDLHLTYSEYQMSGWGDFSIVGDHYTPTGGRPYAVAIHVTYLDEDDDMHIRHFISDSNQTFANTPGKFQEAVEKLVEELDNGDSPIFHSNACNEYRELCEQHNFPQLGYVKKLSIQHHLELMADFLSR